MHPIGSADPIITSYIIHNYGNPWSKLNIFNHSHTRNPKSSNPRNPMWGPTIFNDFKSI